MKKTYIIAEAGVNHNGDVHKALELIEQAKKIGADAVKFQMFQANNLVTETAEQAAYQKISAQEYSNQYTMLKDLELSCNDFKLLEKRAQDLDIDFIVTPFCLDSLDILIKDFEIPYLKISSGDLNHGPLLLRAARSGKKIILSTGMSSLAEIEQALKIVAFGYCTSNTNPSIEILNTIFSSTEGQQLLEKKLTLLHCTSEYPAPFHEINLKAMDTLRGSFGLPVGLSDHSEGISVSLAAVAREACVIEKHFTLDKNLPGPDHKASLDVKEFNALVLGVRQIERALGDARKVMSKAESRNLPLVRRSIVAKTQINKDEIFTENNLTFKRPAKGRSPMNYWDLIGTSAHRNYQVDEVIE